MLIMKLPTAKQSNPYLIAIIIMLLLVCLFPISEEKKEVVKPDNVLSSMVQENGCYYKYKTTRTHHKKCTHDN